MPAQVPDHARFNSLLSAFQNMQLRVSGGSSMALAASAAWAQGVGGGGYGRADSELRRDSWDARGVRNARDIETG